MALKKYKQEQTSIRVPCRTDLNKVQKIMSDRIGCKLTQTQVIQKLLRFYLEENSR